MAHVCQQSGSKKGRGRDEKWGLLSPYLHTTPPSSSYARMHHALAKNPHIGLPLWLVGFCPLLQV